MTWDEFQNKYEKYVEDGHYGNEIMNNEILDYLNNEFELWLKQHIGFKIYQIKIKYGTIRIYTNSDMDFFWERNCNKIFEKYKIVGRIN